MLATLLLTEKHWLLTGDEVHHPSLAGSRQTQAMNGTTTAGSGACSSGPSRAAGKGRAEKSGPLLPLPQQSKDLGFQSTLNSLNLCTTPKYSQDVCIYLLRSLCPACITS